MEDIQTILTYVGEIDYNADKDDKEPYKIVLGFIEKGIPCGCVLGEGYGDVMEFKTEEKAKDYLKYMKEKKEP